MKRLLLAFALLTSSLTYAQSMLVFKNGKVLTIDEQGMIYDLGNFLPPYQIKHIGGRYLVDENRRLRTVDQNGLMYDKTKEDKAPVNIEHFGENFFISKLGKMYTIDEAGYLYEAEKEREFRNIEKRGGNFVIAEKKVEGEKSLAIYVVTNLGKILEVTVPDLNLNQVNFVGGNYFTTSRGVLYTVSEDGFVYSKKEVGHFNGWELKKGGNYFIAGHSLYTISNNGLVSSAAVSSDFGTIKKFGTNFFVTAAGQLFTISSSGSVRNVSVDQKLSDISLFSKL